MRAILVLLIVGTAVATATPRIQRIVGGTVTTIGQYPYATPLLYSRTGSSYSQACAGSILNSRSILSAAHCFVGSSSSLWRIRVGSSYANSGGIVHVTSSIILHPSYNATTFDSDVAVLRSATTFTFNSVVAASSIASSTYNLGDNQAVWAIGWGAVSYGGVASEQLRHVQIWTVNQSTCTSRYAELRKTITVNMLCSGWLDFGGRDQCQGDSGGPLIHNNVVVGVSSWGFECANARYPGVNTRISRFTSWIQANA